MVQHSHPHYKYIKKTTAFKPGISKASQNKITKIAQKEK